MARGGGRHKQNKQNAQSARTVTLVRILETRMRKTDTRQTKASKQKICLSAYNNKKVTAATTPNNSLAPVRTTRDPRDLRPCLPCVSVQLVHRAEQLEDLQTVTTVTCAKRFTAT